MSPESTKEHLLANAINHTHNLICVCVGACTCHRTCYMTRCAGVYCTLCKCVQNFVCPRCEQEEGDRNDGREGGDIGIEVDDGGLEELEQYCNHGCRKHSKCRRAHAFRDTRTCKKGQYGS